MAKEQLVEESAVEEIRRHDSSAALDERDRVLLEYVDRFLTMPDAIDEAYGTRLLAHFSPEQVVEISVGLALFLGFSKLAIALGPVPDGIPRMVLPAPKRPG